MDMFENKFINGIHVSRIIMSWVRMGGELNKIGRGQSDFEQWLKSENLSEEDIKYIVNMATNGKMEIETSAKRFINNIDKTKKSGRYDWKA